MTSNKSDYRTWQRYEAKYLVDEACAERIRAYCRANLTVDPYSACRADMEYPILSVYLDSAGGHCLRGTIDRRSVRMKLRVRTYRFFDDSNHVPSMFFEIKRKVNGVVRKMRSRVPPELGEEVLWGDVTPGTVSWPGADSDAVEGLNEFLQLRSRLRAQPRIGVFYTREAYESGAGDRVRINLDRNLHYGLLDPPGSGSRDMWWPVGLEAVVFEIKFTHTYPGWVADLVRVSEVTRRGVCKYVMCTRTAQTSGSLAAV